MTAIRFLLSSYSYVDGMQYYNINDLREYDRRLATGHLPVNRGEKLANDGERLRRALMLGLKCGVERQYFEDNYATDIVVKFKEQFETLHILGLVSISDEYVKLTDVGNLFADEIGQLFYSTEIRERMNNIPKQQISTTLPHINSFKSVK